MKIIFWLNAFLLFYGLSYNLQKKSDYELYSVVDVTDKTKDFFTNQNLVNFKKQWFLHDHIKKKSEPDINYLLDFEKRYSINIWQLGFNERIFYFYNDFYKFTQNEILSILEQECKLFENILDEVKPDFLIIEEPALHQEQLFYEMCRKKGIRVLILTHSKLGYRCIIVEQMHKIDYVSSLNNVASQYHTFEELINELKSYDSSKQHKLYAKNFGKSKLTKLKAICQYIISDNSNISSNYAYYGRGKLKVLVKTLLLLIQSKFRKNYLDRHSVSKIFDNEKYVLFTLNQEPERSTLIATPLHTNQLEVTRQIAKSLPPGYKLYVKEHYSQSLREWRKISFYKELIQIPNVRLYHPESSMGDLISNSSLVISTGGSTPFEAAFYKKPSIIFADYGFTMLPFIHKLDRLEELPNIIRNALSSIVDPELLGNYLTILKNNIFDFDLVGYYTLEANFFRYGGSLHDTKITNEKMQSFLDSNQSLFELLTEQYIKKLKQHQSKF